MDDLVVFQTILLGTDGSATARVAEDAAAMLAHATGGQLVVVSAFDGSAGSKLAAEEAVNETRARVKAAGIGAWSEVVEGEPAAALVEFARARQRRADRNRRRRHGSGRTATARRSSRPNLTFGSVQRADRAHGEPLA